MEEVGLELRQVDPHGTRQHQPRGGSWWWLRCGNKRRQTDVQWQSHRPNRASGLTGKTWSIGSSHGKVFGKWKESQISFIIIATYDVLPTPKNLNQWFGEDPSCALCQTPATLRHIFTGCKTSLSQGCYMWRHNHVLRQLAITLEGRRAITNALPPPTPRHSNTIPFVRAGQLPTKPSARVENNHPTLCPRLEDAGGSRKETRLPA